MAHDRKPWQTYFDALAARMRLGQWAIHVLDEEPKSDDALASINCWHGRSSATVRLAEKFFDETPEEQREVAVHELVHCYHAHSDTLAEKELAGRASEAWTLAIEYQVDTVAKTIAQFMPLPSEIIKPAAETQ